LLVESCVVADLLDQVRPGHEQPHPVRSRQLEDRPVLSGHPPEASERVGGVDVEDVADHRQAARPGDLVQGQACVLSRHEDAPVGRRTRTAMLNRSTHGGNTSRIAGRSWCSPAGTPQPGAGDPDAREPGPTDGAQPVVIMYISAARSSWIITTA